MPGDDRVRRLAPCPPRDQRRVGLHLAVDVQVGPPLPARAPWPRCTLSTCGCLALPLVEKESIATCGSSPHEARQVSADAMAISASCSAVGIGHDGAVGEEEHALVAPARPGMTIEEERRHASYAGRECRSATARRAARRPSCASRRRRSVGLDRAHQRRRLDDSGRARSGRGRPAPAGRRARPASAGAACARCGGAIADVEHGDADEAPARPRDVLRCLVGIAEQQTVGDAVAREPRGGGHNARVARLRGRISRCARPTARRGGRPYRCTAHRPSCDSPAR